MKVKRSLLFIISIITIAGCATNVVTPEEPRDYLFYRVKEGVSVDELYGSPWLNSAVEGMMERIEKPSEKDDFFAAANYEYLPTITVKEGMQRDGGLLGEADSKTSAQLYTLISGETDSYLSPYIKDAASYLLNGSKEQVKAKIDEINNYTTKDEINNYLYSIDSLSTETSLLTPYDYYGLTAVVPGSILSETGLLYLIYSYRTRTTLLNKIGAAIKELFIDVGYTEEDATSFTDQYVATEAGLLKYFSLNAWAGTTRVNNLDELFPSYKIENLMSTLGYNDNQLVYYLPGTEDYLEAFNNLSLDNAKKVLINRLMFDYAPIIGLSEYREFLNSMSSFEFGTLNGRSDEEALVLIFESLSSKVLERAYYDVYCNAETKSQVMELISEIIDEYKVILYNNTWLSETTKQKAITKVKKMNFDACYPDEIKDYPTFNPSKYSSALDLYSEMTLYNKNGEMFDSSWYWPCYTVNGAYFPTSNSFIIYNGILTDDIFSLKNSIEENYASVGSIIGHEISHAFDSNGSNFDEDGKQVNWWTYSDRQAFNTRLNKMIAYINKIEVKTNIKMKGNRVNGEVTADMGGVKVVLSLAKKIPDFDYETFFERYARLWAFKYKERALVNLNNNDEHPLGYIRTNLTLSQFDEFIETYDIKPGDGMYFAPENRLAIW